MNFIKTIILVFLTVLVFSTDQYAQKGNQESPIVLGNPSFEDRPHIGQEGGPGPRGWHDCGHRGETAPDVQPSPSKDELFFDVDLPAADGKTYVGMVVRDNNTWERISQRLRQPMRAGTCYNFNLNVAHSETYMSVSRRTNQPVNYTKGAVLRIWGGSSYCGKLELLDESPEITNTAWKTYNFRLEPARNYSYIMIEAFYKTPVMFEYNGNVLIDNASALEPVPCDDAPLAKIEDPKEPVTEPEPTDPVDKPDEVKPNEVVEEEPDPTPKKKELLKELNDEVVAGQEIKLDRLYFKADSSNLRQEDLPLLNEIFDFLRENKKVVVEIGGHTNNRCEDVFCNKLSEARAKAVADYLVDKGISDYRVKYKGYGKTKQKYPNNTPTNRRRNQRVELKIITTG